MAITQLDIDNQKKDELYDHMLNDSAFLNDMFTAMGATDKVATLEKAGFNMLNEYRDYLELKNEHEV